MLMCVFVLPPPPVSLCTPPTPRLSLYSPHPPSLFVLISFADLCNSMLAFELELRSIDYMCIVLSDCNAMFFLFGHLYCPL